ncbi:MAG: D-amino-acid transaminase [Acetobacteraceae bacterium]
MSRIAYVNGRYLRQRDAAVNIEDRGYQFGDGVYEVVHVSAGRLIDAELHLARLERSLGEIAIPMPLGRRALAQVFFEVMRRNRVREGLIYMQVTRGVARREHAFPRPAPKPALVVTARRLPPFPRSVEGWAATAITRPDERWQRCDIKSVNLLPNVLAKEAARREGAAEAILIDTAGMVTEGASSSVWVVDRDGRLQTRNLDHVVLPGCTRAALIGLMTERGITWREGAVSKAELAVAREIFVTSASSFVKPVVRLDGKPVGDGRVGPLTRDLFALFSHHVQGAARNAPPAPG